MSWELPERPNLEHLRKQAKALLDDLRRSDPNARLADALHQVARRYGAASWPKLKELVHAKAPEGGGHDASSPFNGRWVADLSRSVRHPANQFSRATMEFAVAGDRVTIRYGYVDESGDRQHGKTTIDVDGHERTMENGYVFSARWRGTRRIETRATRNGEDAGHGSYEVSEDGASLIVVGPEQHLVLSRA